MAVFHINIYNRGVEEFDKRGRPVNKQELNKEWTIFCVFRNENGVISNYALESVEIHKKSTAGKFSVIGELKIDPGHFQLNPGFEYGTVRNIAEFFEIGSSSKMIWPNLNVLVPFKISGSLKISKVEDELTSKESKERIQLNCLDELSKDLESIFNPESYLADVTLKCDCVSIPAHKIILSARSPVFASMFSHPMLESLSNEVDISCINVSTLRALLMHVYTGRTSDLTASSAADLLFAADKFHLQGLKAVCTHFLTESVTLENIWEILVLGDMHSKDLKAFAIQYIRNNLSTLKNKPEWKALRKERPDLAIDIVESLF